MSNKMCNECKRCDGDLCTYFDNYSDRESTIACILFEPKKPTNGDVIRQMSNAELAKFLSTQVICPNCPARTEECIGNASKVCKKNWLAWLNAPAESEGEDE